MGSCCPLLNGDGHSIPADSRALMPLSVNYCSYKQVGHFIALLYVAEIRAGAGSLACIGHCMQYFDLCASILMFIFHYTVHGLMNTSRILYMMHYLRYLSGRSV